MSRRKRTNFEESLWTNAQAWHFYADRLCELSISMFEWKNLPETVDERYLELKLFVNGSVVFFKDEVMGHLALPWTNNGQLSVYGIPRKRRAYAVNGYQSDVLNEDNSVLIYNNRLHTNSVRVVEYYARQLWDMDRVIDVNIINSSSCSRKSALKSTSISRPKILLICSAACLLAVSLL